MAAKWLTCACLLLAGSAAAADDIVHMKDRAFQIPIRVQPDRAHEVKELILYMSSNKGGNWEISGRADPTRNKVFDFHAPNDGVYYFSVATIDSKTGKQDPVNVYGAPVQMKVAIDSKPPVVKLTDAKRFGDEIEVSWQADDENPDTSSFRLEWRPADNAGGSWTPLPVQPSKLGMHKFRVNVPGDVHVRASLKDLAANEGAEEKVVRGAMARTDQAVQLTRNDDLPPPGPTPPPMPAPPPPQPVNPMPLPTNSTPSPQVNTQPAVTQPAFDRTPLTTSSNASPMPAPGPTRGPLPQSVVVNKPNQTLGFDVRLFGPSGLGTVDIFVTEDEGQTWRKTNYDPAVSLPVSPESNSQTPVEGTVTVQLPQDGKIYGYYLVVKSRAGLSKPEPVAGTVPQVRLERDTTKPEATLYMPKADEMRGSTLVLLWKAEDRNLAPNPITLEWSPNGTSQWAFIGGAALPNTGSYKWEVPKNIPPKVFLKLTVRDSAGNDAVAQTGDAVMIDLTVPEIGSVRVIRR